MSGRNLVRSWCALAVLIAAVEASAINEQEISHDYELLQHEPASGSVNWIAEWTNGTGWTTHDNRILNDGSVFWQVDARSNQTGSIDQNAAVLSDHDLCWASPDGYGNNWYQALRLEYSGTVTLSFDYLLDCENGDDHLRVETDPNCDSFGQVNYSIDPSATAASFRTVEYEDTGLNVSGSVSSLALTNHGAGTHCVYISFHSDGWGSQEDGSHTTTIGAAAVIDNIVLAGGTSLSEDFEGVPPFAVTFVNIQDTEPFGDWAVTYPAVTDNDLCSASISSVSSWAFVDDVTPSTACIIPDYAFFIGGFVVKNWLDNDIVSPWVSLASSPGATNTHLEFRTFPGNDFWRSRIAMNYTVRAKTRIENTDSPAFGDSVDCVTPWSPATEWYSLGAWTWLTRSADISAFVDQDAEAVQVKFRIADWQLPELGDATPPPLTCAAPGPYIEQIRIGRRAESGSLIRLGVDSRSQAQDAFPTDPAPFAPEAQGAYVPSTDRFGTAAFSKGSELTINSQGPNLVTGDSIIVQVVDVRNTGVVTVELWGNIIAGPHAGKAPPPYTAAAGGWFTVPAQNARTPQGTNFKDVFFVDLDDDYFRGGDVLVYFWAATDGLGGLSTDPGGITSLPPPARPSAEAATGGLHEVSFLPRIDWATSYLNRIAADPNGKLDPTPSELASSVQTHDILYVQKVNPHRRSGPLNRTAFMFALDNAGYTYDVYDLQGYGNTNNDLGSRATVQQATGYALIVHDTGRRRSGNIPDGSDLDSEKIDQQTWYRQYLAQAASSEAGRATLWLIGENIVEEEDGGPLLTDAGTTLLDPACGICYPSADAVGVATFTFQDGTAVDFTTDTHTLAAGCGTSTHHHFDELTPAGTAVGTHNYQVTGGTSTGFAVVMNANPSQKWNTIVSAFSWDTIMMTLPPKPGTAAEPPPDVASNGQILLEKILEAVAPRTTSCACAVDWTQPSVTGPSARSAYAMAYDASRGVTILFGGADAAGTRLGDTWQWDGSAWTLLAPASSPSPRSGAVMTYDSDRQFMVLYGGHDGASRLGETWEWRGTNWQYIQTADSSPQTDMGLAYDANRHVTVRYGGTTNTGRSRSTFEYAGTAWTLITNNSAPGYRSKLAMEFDAGLGSVVMFGGQAPGGVLKSDTWTWDGTTWTQIATSGPSARQLADMAFDSDCGGLYLFGGNTSGGLSDELWHYAAGTWTPLPSSITPSPRMQHRIVYDAARAELVLFGGDTGTRNDETWLHNCDEPIPSDAETDTSVPSATRVLGSYPNPFNPRTTIRYALAREGQVHLSIYDIRGRRVSTLIDARRQAGVHAVTWDGRDDTGAPVMSGLYFYRLRTRDADSTGKLVLIK
ncbi:MAG: T9SS type A sorting domain-containing protein [Candidatus Krumholzibacteriia bacterium]